MIINILLLLFALVVILVAAVLFTNAVEWLGKRLRLAEGAIGSVLAAVGTALPETLLPVVAILLYGGAAHAEVGAEIGVGAILGAPFMLSTLAMFVTGLAAVVYRKRRRQGAQLVVTQSVLRRDMSFFLVLYGLAVSASLVPMRWGRVVICCLLVGGYALYLWQTFRGGEEAEHEIEGLTLRVWFVRVFLRPEPEEDGETFGERRRNHALAAPRNREIALQALLALGAIIGGAWIFARGVDQIAHAAGISPLVLALIIAPVATELPEKSNSVIWVRDGKDTFALGNITGAMVFQSSIPVTLGILLTPWNLHQSPTGGLPPALVSVVIALVAAATMWLVAGLTRPAEGVGPGRQTLPAWIMVVGLAFFVLYPIIVFWR